MRVVLVAGTQCTEAALRDTAVELAGAYDVPVSVRVVAKNGLDAAADAVLADGDPALLVGHSLGGTVCLAAARRHPDKTLGMVLVATNPRPPTRAQQGAWRRQEALAVDRGPRAVVEELLPRLLGDDDGSREWREAADTCREMAERTGLGGFRRQLAVQRDRIDERIALRSCPVPVLAVSAGSDRVVPAGAVEELAGAAPRGEHAVLPGAAHMVPLQDPQALARVVLLWWPADPAVCRRGSHHLTGPSCPGR